MPFLDTKHKKKSFTLTTLLLSALLLLLFYIGLTYMDPPIENGITVNFGTMEFGMGEVQPTEPIRPRQQEQEIAEPVAEPVPEETTPEPEVEETAEADQPAEKVLTRESEEAIRMKQAEEARRRTEEAARKAREEAARLAREKQEAEERARLEQEAKKKELDALMGGLGNTQGQADGSEGDDARGGDKGDPAGDPYASTYYGSPGSGSGSEGYGLKGRTLAGKGQVIQECNQSGRVVVEIVVDRSGKVISAKPGVRGTTNNDPCLLEPARKTAFLHRWQPDSKAPERQVGFVVVNFKLGQ
jgi:outer membrane biosynthesis protein TonB